MFKKFLKKNTRTRNENVKFFIPEKCSKKCKVIFVNNDLSMIILLDYKGETFKWNFKLDNIPSINMLYFKNQLEKMVLYKTFEIQVLNFIDGYIHGVLFDKYKNKSINTMFGFFISTYETKNNNLRSNNYKNFKTIKLDTIFEEKETHF